MGLGKSYKKKNIELKGIVLDNIPNLEKEAEIIFSAGSSKAVNVPSGWRMHLPEPGEQIHKLLIKIKVNDSIFTYTEYYGLLVLPNNFPLDKFTKE